MNRQVTYDVSGTTAKRLDDDQTYGFAAFVASQQQLRTYSQNEKGTSEIVCANSRYNLYRTPEKITLKVDNNTVAAENRYLNPLLKTSVHLLANQRDPGSGAIPTVCGTLSTVSQNNNTTTKSLKETQLETNSTQVRTVQKCSTVGTCLLILTLLVITGTTGLILFLTVGRGLTLFSASYQYAVQGEFSVLNVNYSSRLASRDSAEYKTMAATIQHNLDFMFKGNHLLADSYNHTSVTSLEPGSKNSSVRVQFQTILNAADFSAAEKMGLVFLGSLHHKDNHRFLGQYAIDLTSISFSETVPAQTGAIPTTPIVKWSEWSNWTACSEPCNPLQSQTRYRTCHLVEPANSPTHDAMPCMIAAVNGDGSSDVQLRSCMCPKFTSRPRIPFSVVRATKPTNSSTFQTHKDRTCDNCKAGELCIARSGETNPVCRWPPDAEDPTGCGGFCRVGIETCYRVSTSSFRCEEDTSCASNEWRCQNGLCIAANKRCDGQFNCYDHSDEFQCECDDNHLKCGNGTSCITKDKRCDGRVDCWDGSDERNCTLPCPAGQFACTKGGCVAQVLFCDGFADCPDGTDEPAGCGGSCRSHERRCRNGRCVKQHTFCDGFNTCGDNSDEENCTFAWHPNTTSVANLVDPRSSYLQVAGSDTDYEVHCDPLHEFQCANWECVPKSSACDQVNDCGDWSDEYKCSPYRTKEN